MRAHEGIAAALSDAHVVVAKRLSMLITSGELATFGQLSSLLATPRADAVVPCAALPPLPPDPSPAEYAEAMAEHAFDSVSLRHEGSGEFIHSFRPLIAQGSAPGAKMKRVMKEIKAMRKPGGLPLAPGSASFSPGTPAVSSAADSFGRR